MPPHRPHFPAIACVDSRPAGGLQSRRREPSSVRAVAAGRERHDAKSQGEPAGADSADLRRAAGRRLSSRGRRRQGGGGGDRRRIRHGHHHQEHRPGPPQIPAALSGHGQYPVLCEGARGIRPDRVRDRRAGGGGRGDRQGLSAPELRGFRHRQEQRKQPRPRSSHAAFSAAPRDAAGCPADPEGRRLRECGSAVFPARTARLGANRDLDGVRKVVLDAVVQAQGKGCSPGILGVCIGGDRATGYLHSKEQLLRTLEDASPDPALAAIEQEIVRDRQRRWGSAPWVSAGRRRCSGARSVC